MPGSTLQSDSLSDRPHEDDLQSYLRKSYKYLEKITPLSRQNGLTAVSIDLDIRHHMWRTPYSSESPVDQSANSVVLSEMRRFLRNAEYSAILEGGKVVDATLKEDLTEMAELLSTMVASRDKDAILEFTDEYLRYAMDVFQTLIDGNYDNNGLFQKVLLRIARKKDLLPAYLYLSGVQKKDDLPLKGGGFSNVYIGQYLMKAVALKVLRTVGMHNNTIDIRKLFRKEAMIWRQLNHRNVLPLYGISEELFKPDFCLISPWMENGDLNTFLKDHGHVNRVEIINMIADGLRYLHSFGDGIVHGDLRGRNILFGKDGVPRIADFGLTHIVVGPHSSRLYSLSSGAGGCANWHAPELLCDSNGDASCAVDVELMEIDEESRPEDARQIVNATKASDIYSFGCVCHEVFTGKPPFARLSTYQVISAVAHKRQRPARPQHALVVQRGLDDAMWYMMESCWEWSAENRPPISEVMVSLHSRP